MILWHYVLWNIYVILFFCSICDEQLFALAKYFLRIPRIFYILRRCHFDFFATFLHIFLAFWCARRFTIRFRRKIIFCNKHKNANEKAFSEHINIISSLRSASLKISQLFLKTSEFYREFKTFRVLSSFFKCIDVFQIFSDKFLIFFLTFLANFV